MLLAIPVEKNPENVSDLQVVDNYYWSMKISS